MPCILTRCRAFILLRCNTARYKRLQRVLPCQCKLYRPCHKTAHRALQQLFLRLHPFNYPRYQTDTTSHYRHMRHAGGHTRAWTRSTDTRYHRHAGTLYRSAQPAYYNKVYKRVQGCALLWIHARRRSISQTMPAAASRCFPRPAEQSSSRGAEGGAEPLAAVAASLFGLSPDS